MLTVRRVLIAKRPRPGLERRAGFTLIELLLIIAIIAILAGLLLPTLSSGKARAKQAGCLNNLSQLALCAQMYSGDNEGKLADNVPSGQDTNCWVMGNLKLGSDSTNQTLIRQGELFGYANNAGIYQCPADTSQTGGVPRVRSYSMNSWIGSQLMESESSHANAPVAYRTFIRESDLATRGPNELWLLVDEHEVTIDDGWFMVTMDDSQPFASSPASRHSHAYGLAFVDGHSQVHKLRDPSSWALPAQRTILPSNLDWIKLKEITTSRYAGIQ
jgi:prepilin-type N-terminal cleavage/methylation domain-containing protein